jgi:hypothetical protein
MGLVTDTLLERVHKQLDAHSTLVWYDPEQVYLDLAQSSILEQVSPSAFQRYDPERGFVWLRRQLEPLWTGRDDPPRLLIYVPRSQAGARDALIEFEVAGAVLQPGQHPPERNTALAAVARRALAALLPEAQLEEIVGQVEAGQLSLSELDDLAEVGIEALTGVIVTIFGTGNASEVAVRFLSDPAVDTEIEARQALGSLAGLLSEALGVSLQADLGPAALRVQLARQVLITDLIEAVGDGVPQALRTFPVAERPVARRAAAQIAQGWRNRRDLAESYVHWAGRVQAEIGFGALDLDLPALARTETFAAGEVRLQKQVERVLAKRVSSPLIELVETRLGGFWSVQQPEIKTRWKVVAEAGRVLLGAARLENDLKGRAWTAEALLSGYAYGKSPPERGGDDEPWCQLDTAQRRLERDFHNFDLDPDKHKSLVRLVAHARHRYATVANRLAELFTRAYAEAQFELPGVLLQADIYREAVGPAIQAGRAAYILVDALRFEMARELLTVLQPEGSPEPAEKWTHDLTPALATPPTLTEVGMAALLPGAERGVAVVEMGGKLAAIVAGQTLKTRQERIAYLGTVVEGKLAVTKLHQLAPLSDDHLREEIKAARLVVVTATEEIDTLCESNPALARRTLDDVLSQVRRGIKTLFGLGVQSVVISADHGYLFGEKLSPGIKIDAPGGQTVALKRRVWVGKGGADLPGVLRGPLSAFGIGGELEMATPVNLSCFKVKGGGTEYFHGGLSLQELVIPVLTVHPGATPVPTEAAPVQWTVTLGSHTISTRFVSVTIQGVSTQLLPLEPPTVRVEVRSGEQPISVPVSARYGFDEITKDVELALGEGGPPQVVAVNTVALMITEEPDVQEVTVHLLDATTGISQARLDGVPFAIAL